MGTLPESEMERVALFDDVPDNYTYDPAEERADFVRIGEVLKTGPRGYKRVEVSPYAPAWADDFQKIKRELDGVLNGLVLSIEHVGSTSVPGLSAKPIIDIDVVIKDEAALPPVIKALQSIGYQHNGDQGIKGREAFDYEGKEHLRKHHLYVCAADSSELKRHMTFRDYLRSDPEAVRGYSRVKEEGAALYPFDIDGYIAYKSPFIEQIYKKLGI